MSISGIESGLPGINTKLTATARPEFAKSEVSGKAFANHLLRADTVELSSVAKKKVEASQTLLKQAHGTRLDAQQAPAAEFYSRADVTGLFAQWGEVKPGSEYDFDQNGVVDAQDLATLLSRIGQAKPESKAAEPEGFDRSDVDRLLEAWNDGSDPSRGVNERYDLDGDGRVDASDLAALLAQLPAS